MSFWQRIGAFFRLDFHSAFGTEPTSLQTDSTPGLPDGNPVLPFELDIRRLEYVDSRRKVLEWRDAFAVGLLSRARDAFGRFAEAAERKSDATGILDKVFAKSAADMLEDDFSELVRGPLAELASAAERELLNAVSKLPSAVPPSKGLTLDEIDPFLSVLGDTRFRPSNLDEVVSKLKNLVFGEEGIIDGYVQRSQAVTLEILRSLDTRA